MSETILELMEARVKALTAAVAEETAHVLRRQKLYESAEPHRRSVELSLLTKATMNLVSVTGRQREAESGWRLVKAHKGERIS